MQIDDLLRLTASEEASDLHLKPMRPPLMRTKGKLLQLDEDPIPPSVLKDMIYKILSDKQRRELEESLFLDFGYSLGGVSRFRGSVYYQRGTVAAVFRCVPFKFPSLDDWGLPEVLKEFTRLPHGLVLVTGPSGAGKSSTLAALIKEILDNRLVHVVTIEDPIEFLLTDNQGSISQREVGTDTRSFSDALRNTVRQDPDVIMVGEMRDPETVATVLSAAETGHLVFSTLHANSAAQSVDRILGSFSDSVQNQVRQQLAQILQGVIALQLVERADRSGMIASVEIMRRNPKISKLIADGKVAELHEEIERSVSFEKMQSTNQSLVALVLNGAITRESALAHSPSPGEFNLELGQFLRDSGPAGEGGDDDMASSQADFSKILELREIRKLYDEMQERYRQEMSDKDAYIASLHAQLVAMDTSGAEGSASMRALREERDKLAQQLSFQKQDHDAKVEKLQLRIKELSAQAAESGRGTIFRR